jgi:hypothetical protein
LSVSSRSNSGQQQKTRQRELTGFDCAIIKLLEAARRATLATGLQISMYLGAMRQYEY